jgi:hypothetical protein
MNGPDNTTAAADPIQADPAPDDPRPASGRHRTRAQRLADPRMSEVMLEVAKDYGVCVRPIALRRVDVDTGQTRIIDVPCSATLASKCPSCAERRRRLRMADCRIGWHLDAEPVLQPDPPTPEQQWLAAFRADVQLERDTAQTGADLGRVADLDDVLADIDAKLRDLQVRGRLDPSKDKPRRTRSTRRRQDAPDLPRRKVDPSTLGRTFTTPTGTVLRPSMAITLTLGSYGRVLPDGTPADPASYDYRGAARDAIHFPKLVDRFWQNTRRAVGYDVQYFATVEPQRRLAPHLHAAIRGTISRAELRAIVAATYHQVWWPATDVVRYDGGFLPLWDPQRETYVDPDTGEPLPTWDDALDALGEDDDAEPMHVVRFGSQLHAEGMLAGTKHADDWIRYLAKYLTKSVAECHSPDTDRQRDHVERMHAALRYEPCSPTCANWLRYGIVPKHARAQQQPGYCKGKVHRRETLGLGGRRVLTSRKWSGKSLGDHKQEQRAWVLDLLGQVDHAHDSDTTPDHTAPGEAPPRPARYVFEPVKPGDPAVEPLSYRLMRAIADREHWRHKLKQAQDLAAGQPPDGALRDVSATTQAA